MLIIMIAVAVVMMVGFVLWGIGYHKEINSPEPVNEFDKINSIEDPLLRQVAINDWLNKRV